MKKKILLIMLLVFSMIIYAGCSNKSQDLNEEPKTNEEIVVEKPEERNEEKLDFGGRTMNVVTTSEKYVELFDAFAKEVNAKVEFLSMSSGEVIARIEAEGGKPMADLWFGGGLDAFMAAKDKGYDLGLPKDKLIDQDISTFGSMRESILTKWEELTKGK